MKMQELISFEKGSLFKKLITTMFKLTFTSATEDDVNTLSKLIEDIGEEDNDDDVNLLLEDLKDIKRNLEEENEDYFNCVVKLGQDVGSIL